MAWMIMSSSPLSLEEWWIRCRDGRLIQTESRQGVGRKFIMNPVYIIRLLTGKGDRVAMSRPIDGQPLALS